MLQLLFLRPFLWGASAGNIHKLLYFMPSSGLHALTGPMDQQSEKYTKKNLKPTEHSLFCTQGSDQVVDTKNLTHHLETHSQRKP